MKHFIILFNLVLLISCTQEEWYCRTNGDMMYSQSASGEIGGAQKGCTCEEIRNHELYHFKSVDEEALKSDFGC